MKIVFLDAGTLGNIDLHELYQLGEAKIFETTSDDEVLERVQEAEVIITNKVKFGGKQLNNLPQLKCILVTATGLDNIDLTTAQKKGIQVKNAKGYSTNSVLTHTMSMFFHLSHNMAPYERFTRNGDWIDHQFFCQFNDYDEMSALKWGIIGLGEIGRSVAQVVTSFGAEVSYFSTSGKNNNAHFARFDLETLLKVNDVISIHAPLNEQTRNLIAREELELMKPGAVLINVGRGGIINEYDLAEILQKRDDLKVGLDVIDGEPMNEHSSLVNVLGHPNLLITPHLAWASLQARKKLWQITLENLKEFLESKEQD